jgi:voltage-gated potassium channel Kch
MEHEIQKNDSFQQEMKQYDKIIIFALGVILFGATFYHFVEKLNWIDSLYFTVITLATVGYGDITPQTNLGKIFTIVYVIVGVGIFVALANTLIHRSMAIRRAKIQSKENTRK